MLKVTTTIETTLEPSNPWSKFNKKSPVIKTHTEILELRSKQRLGWGEQQQDSRNQ